MPDVQPGLATLTASGWDVIEPREGGRFGPSASGDVADLAALLSIASPGAGQTARVVAPVIAGGVPYTKWVYDGGSWRLDGRQHLYFSLTPVVGSAGTSEQFLRALLMAPGLLPLLRMVNVRWLTAKSGTTDSVSGCRVRIGTTATTADRECGWDGSFGASSRTHLDEYDFFSPAPTTVRTYFVGLPATSSLASSGTAYPLDSTLASGTTADPLYLSLTAQMAGATDVPSIPHVIISGS